ncbi:hypothetical protein N7520_007502 [Penicillium odoratum]|uniref:uncharacterized protein n=1 Tax=Penicillium odoratum TaxID=1167516 RepID=UPI0025475DBB|nr:uncharacterized protein N7520_007502 [Penicillium odoratum]KAJ5760346.1 hypothetical protein N7520_007502 [Penicillium odoratum]
MQLPLSITTFLAISSQTLGASLFGLYRIQKTIDGQDVVLTGQGENKAPAFEAPIGKASQIWRFEDQGDNNTIIQSVPTKYYLNCGPGCLESSSAQTFYVEHQGPFEYTFFDLDHDQSLRSTDKNGIALADVAENTDKERFEVIRVEFCE